MACWGAAYLANIQQKERDSGLAALAGARGGCYLWDCLGGWFLSHRVFVLKAESKFGRQYIVNWDDEARRYHVTLGRESIGFHLTKAGAKHIAVSHAQHVMLPQASRKFAVTFVDSP